MSASRVGWHVALENYAVARKRAKRQGRRTPRPADHNPNGYPKNWYGAAKPAALHVLYLWHLRYSAQPESADQVVRNLVECVSAALASDGELTPAQHQLLAACVAEPVQA